MNNVSMNSATQAARKPLCILSLDGGGVRGLSSLMILEAIMTELTLRVNPDSDEDLRPCEVFDLIVGSSTGGLIALMLGRLRMSVSECITAYLNIFGTVFGERINESGKGKALYDAKKFEAQIKELIKQRAAEDPTLLVNGECRMASSHPCRTAVTAIRQYFMDSPAHRFRSYGTSTARPDKTHVWEAARATTATMSFFDPITIGAPGTPYLDGALGGHNNPSRIALEEADLIDGDVHCLVSIGTGMQDPVDFSGDLATIADTCQKIVISCSRVHDEMAQLYGTRDIPVYFRFNVNNGMNLVIVNEWERQDQIAAYSQAYMGLAEMRHLRTRLVGILATQLQTKKT